MVNARDAVGEKGHIWVSTANRQLSEEDCRLLPEAKPGRYVVLAVKDDGCGMDSEVLKRIFEPFFTTKGEGKGTGLGLATVFGIVKQNNGFIVVESEPGKGSTFEIYFPVVEGEKAEARDAAAPIPRGWETILLVEDQPEVLEAASSLLKQLGYQVLSAKSPEQALAVAASYQGVIHLLLSDVGLPGMSGSELAQHLVAVRPEMKVLLMTGYTQEAPLRTEAEKAWGPVLEKPLTAEALAHRVRQVLEGKA
ncbi:MAG: ATP-binding protein [Acidobacteriota bacterium]